METESDGKWADQGMKPGIKAVYGIDGAGDDSLLGWCSRVGDRIQNRENGLEDEA